LSDAGSAAIPVPADVTDANAVAQPHLHGSETVTKEEAIRCLKRYVAREVFAALPR
jgi:hypothetical protein